MGGTEWSVVGRYRIDIPQHSEMLLWHSEIQQTAQARKWDRCGVVGWRVKETITASRWTSQLVGLQLMDSNQQLSGKQPSRGGVMRAGRGMQVNLRKLAVVRASVANPSHLHL
ncbi:unnamed protein product [Acanthocheilonema viteae]|uniref:Uncharacterized protein n=1 Tax=Acanthocheilonema viteae TaxID=6277 RepID=A0A498SDK3_ACAVI|nr:unnamed protein product [Acanthocheilonema viteae]